MVFQLQVFSNYGSSTPAVARTVMQASELMQAFPISDEIRSEVNAALFEVQRQLIRCVQVWEQVRDSVAEAKDSVVAKELEVQAGGRSVTLPGVPDLENQAESFLQSAKLAIRDAARILTPFFGVSFEHRFDRILSWAHREFLDTDDLVRCLAHWQPWINRIVTMRNFVDHPRQGDRDKLIVENFKLVPTERGVALQEPCWGLSAEPPLRIVDSMGKIIEGILCLSEDLLSICLLKNRGEYPLVIREIPDEKRDPACPMRLRVDIDLPIKDT